VSYSMLERFLTKKEVARLRMASDVMVLMQTTDQLSASLQEHLYAGSVVIAGDWLPYVVFENEGIFFLRAGLEDVRNRISDVVENIERFRTLGRENRERVYRFSNWRSRIQTWKEIYES
jgi:glycosyltransferase involved in cell wall biosynthesis